ncbi:MFS transporter [Nocardiopsis oceani]
MSGQRSENPRRTPSADGRRGDRLVILLVVTFLAFVNYAALLSVVPLWTSEGGAASVLVGAMTGVMMAATVGTQVAMPWLFALIRLRTMMVFGAVLLGAPTPLYAMSTEVAPIMAITVVRGIGFAFVVVAGATLVADLAPEGRLSTAASYYGVAAALPNLAALAGGVWIAQTWGFSLVFGAAGAASLLGAVLAVRLPGENRGSFHLVSVGDMRAIAAPMVLFLVTAGSFGAVTTFLPVSGPGAGAVTLALLAASVALVVGRLGAGAIGDRYGPARLLTASVLTGALGCVLIAGSLDGPTWVLLLGAALLGAGFGACQNDSFVVTVQRLGVGRGGTASTVWNIAYDGGLGLGAVALGWVIGGLGYAGAFVAMAAVAAAVTTLCWMPRLPRIAGKAVR